MTADIKSPCLHDSMDKLWFYQNIVCIEPDVVSLRSMLTRPKNINTSSSDENTNRQSNYKDRRPAGLKIVKSKPLFQLQSTPKSTRKQRMKSYKSLSELENYELKGFMDLGFTFPRDELSAKIMRILPGLQRFEKKDGEHGDNRQVTRPYLSESWLVNNQLLNLKALQGSTSADDMKKHLKYWAHLVAMLVHEEEALETKSLRGPFSV
ncbi:uncharacterized protein A4U43_C07F5050 [Asparagus officinalis]|uniref:Uncharacterized protein n=1 Tax=Asparagus officinalis TaxID=4686 RepID=A0A5P1ECT6_ASPOF|nr:uncharacterized protein LOC109850404 [Asparagus officinalis]ONK62531.1 uncharacterized protein A4U43_C07F5050 [Asparagus officinalis]